MKSLVGTQPVLTYSAPVGPLPSAERWPPFWTHVSVGAFYLSLFLVYSVPLVSGAWGVGVVVGALLLGVLVAPSEYALGAIACAFLAASCARLGTVFQQLRWVFLALGVMVLPLRFFLTKRNAPGGIASKFAYLVAFFLGVSAASLITSVSVELTALKLIALASLLYIAWRASANLIDRHGPSGTYRLALGLLAYPLALILFSIVAYFLPFGVSVSMRGGFGGFIGGANACGAAIAMALPWIAGSCFRLRGRSGRWRGVWIFSLAVASYGLLLTGSRAALLGAVVAFAFFSLIHVNRRMTAVVLLLCVVVTAEMLAKPDLLSILSDKYLYKHKVKGKVQHLEDPLQSRALPWNTAKANFSESPWLGLGFGVTSKAESGWSMDIQSGPHALETGSSFWGILVQVGILGAAPLFLAILMLLIDAGRFAWRLKDPWFTSIYGSTLALAVNSLFEGWLIAPGSFQAAYFWVQCFLLNALICRFRPAPARPYAGFSPAAAEDWVRGRI